jgi:Bacteriophage head to tail connecting protein
MSDQSPVAMRKAKSERAWQLHSGWDHLYQDAHDYVIPYRKSGGVSSSKRIADKIFDMTGPNSAMHLAGTLQRLLFSQPPSLRAGGLVRVEKSRRGLEGMRELEKLDRALETTGEFMYPFMEAGNLDTSTHEMCIDLGFGTGVLIPMRGTPDRPIVFHAPAAHEVALAGDAYGETTLVSWKRMVPKDGLLEAFPKGNFSKEFRDSCNNSPSAEVALYQDFWKLPDGRWQFAAYMDQHCSEFIVTEAYRTKPVATPRYYRVAGEMRGRGPILMALPSIKVQNKAQELVLKAAAIQMLGLWGYRSSAFNPDTASLEPGGFLAMQSTGGIMGPDIVRLDPAAGRLDIASMLMEGNAQQIRDAMMDTRLPNETGTPKSASEIAARMEQNKGVHMGGFMRLWREVYPDIVPRCAEILASFGYLSGVMDFNQLLVSVGVRSPMAAAVDADKVGGIARYAEMMNALVGPEKLPEHLDLDKAGDAIADAMMIPKNMVPDSEARMEIRKALQAQKQQAVESEAMVKAAPNIAAGGLRMIEGGLAA